MTARVKSSPEDARADLLAWGGLALRLVGLGLILVWGLSAQPEEPVKLTMCELFRDLKAFSGKLVEIRGELVTSRHGYSLLQRDCPGRLVLGGQEWARALHLAAAGPLVLDEKAVGRMDKLLCFLDSSTAAELGVEITATFTGELRAYGEKRVDAFPVPRTYWVGCGHMAMFPAELVYRTVKDIVIKQKPQ